MQRRLAGFILGTCACMPWAHAEDVTVPAFGGHLLGSDRGEWIGTLEYVTEEGARQTVLKDNIKGIALGPSGIFAIGGLGHLDTNRGAVYRIERGADGIVTAREAVTLTGAPSQVRTYADGTADFLVFEGWLGEREYFRCYRLVDATVQPANTCEPPAR